MTDLLAKHSFVELGARQRAKSFAEAKIDHRQTAAVAGERQTMGEGGAPVGDHRQGIGEVDTLEAVATEGWARIEGRGIAGGKADGEPGAADVAGRRLQHFAGDVAAAERDPGIAAADGDEIAGGAAAELQHGAAGRHVEVGDQSVATEQVGLARGVVDVARQPVHAVHGVGLGTHTATRT